MRAHVVTQAAQEFRQPVGRAVSGGRCQRIQPFGHLCQNRTVKRFFAFEMIEHRLLGQANCKLLRRGGIEANHVKLTHRDTIGPNFLDNLSSYARLVSHMRPILPRNSLLGLRDMAAENWNIRDHANVLYTVFPCNQFLVMQDHVGWISMRPLAPDRIELRLTTLAPRDESTADKAAHWARNQKVTETTLNEDLSVNGAAQAGVASGANEARLFGDYEGALHAFNAQVEARLSKAG